MQPRAQVLVVDDDPGVLRSMQLLLEDDCDVTAVSSAREALGVAAQKRFDAVVTDLRMPDMNGAELATALNQCSPFPVYCILLTGTPSEVGPSTPGASDLVMVLAKPIEPERLIRVVTQIARLGVNRRPRT